MVGPPPIRAPYGRPYGGREGGYVDEVEGTGRWPLAGPCGPIGGLTGAPENSLDIGQETLGCTQRITGYPWARPCRSRQVAPFKTARTGSAGASQDIPVICRGWIINIQEDIYRQLTDWRRYFNLLLVITLIIHRGYRE